MTPFIRDGDVLTVSPLPDGVARRGDVVAYVPSGARRLAIHRLVGVEGDAAFIRGDNTSRTVECVPGHNILGSVTRVERNGKRVYFALGPERFVLVLFGCKGPLFQLLYRVWRFVRPVVRRNSLPRT